MFQAATSWSECAGRTPHCWPILHHLQHRNGPNGGPHHHSPLRACTHTRYLPIGGLRDFVTESVKLAYGDNHAVLKDNLVAAVQSLSGTGSCRLFADFQHR